MDKSEGSPIDPEAKVTLTRREIFLGLLGIYLTGFIAAGLIACVVFTFRKITQ